MKKSVIWASVGCVILTLAVVFGLVPMESLLMVPFMIGITYSYPDTGRSWQDNARVFYLTRTITILAATTAGDIWQALNIPAGTLVKNVKCIIVTAGVGTTFNFDIGDGDDDNGWDDAIDAKGTADTVTASLEATDAYGPGKYYATADTIDVKTAVATSVTGAAVIKIVAECVDMTTALGGGTVSS